MHGYGAMSSLISPIVIIIHSVILELYTLVHKIESNYLFQTIRLSIAMVKMLEQYILECSQTVGASTKITLQVIVKMDLIKEDVIFICYGLVNIMKVYQMKMLD